MRRLVQLTALAAILGLPTVAQAYDTPDAAYGVAIRMGGRFDNMRMCVATPEGFKAGPMADISLYTELGLSDRAALNFTLPIFRPVMFAAAFRMLQFEPDFALLFRAGGSDSASWVVGPTAGVSLHFGPDNLSSAANRGIEFFAWGPVGGLYAGRAVDRPDKDMDLEYGLGLNATPMFAEHDLWPGHEPIDGIVVAGYLSMKLAWAR